MLHLNHWFAPLSFILAIAPAGPGITANAKGLNAMPARFLAKAPLGALIPDLTHSQTLSIRVS